MGLGLGSLTGEVLKSFALAISLCEWTLAVVQFVEENNCEFLWKVFLTSNRYLRTCTRLFFSLVAKVSQFVFEAKDNTIIWRKTSNFPWLISCKQLIEAQTTRVFQVKSKWYPGFTSLGSYIRNRVECTRLIQIKVLPFCAIKWTNCCLSLYWHVTYSFQNEQLKR